MSGPVGEYRWGGAAGTAFWVDPKDEMTSVLMTQGAPGPARGYTGTLFRQMAGRRSSSSRARSRRPGRLGHGPSLDLSFVKALSAPQVLMR